MSPIGVTQTTFRRLVRLVVAGFLCHLYLVSVVQAQTVGRVEMMDTNINSYYYFVRPGSATIQIYVLGTVRSPGVYEINQSTDLRQLLALTGGPVLATQDRSASRRTVSLQLFRPNAAGQELLYEASLEDALAAPGDFPSLLDGDILMVQVFERSRPNLRNVLTFSNALLLFALTIERFTR